MSEETIREMVKLFFDEEQKREFAQTMAEKVADQARLEEEKAEITKRYKADIDKTILEIKDLAGKLRDGYYYDRVQCHVVRDFHMKEVHVIRCDTCELIKSRSMRPEELQLTFDDSDKEAANDIRE